MLRQLHFNSSQIVGCGKALAQRNTFVRPAELRNVFYCLLMFLLLFDYSKQSLVDPLKIMLRLSARENPHNCITLSYFAFFLCQNALRRPKWND